MFGGPAEGTDLRRVDGVTLVMVCAVLDEAHEGAGVVGQAGAVDLVGRDVEEALDIETAGGLQQDVDTVDVGLDEGAGVVDRAVDMSLRREVNDGVAAFERGVDSVWVTDVALDEAI